MLLLVLVLIKLHTCLSVTDVSSFQCWFSIIVPLCFFQQYMLPNVNYKKPFTAWSDMRRVSFHQTHHFKMVTEPTNRQKPTFDLCHKLYFVFL